MEESLVDVLPNLSIGVVSIAALVYITITFINKLDERSKAHEEALRQVEKEVRDDIIGYLRESSQVIANNAKIMERVIGHLDKH